MYVAKRKNYCSSSNDDALECAGNNILMVYIQLCVCVFMCYCCWNDAQYTFSTVFFCHCHCNVLCNIVQLVARRKENEHAAILFSKRAHRNAALCETCMIQEYAKKNCVSKVERKKKEKHFCPTTKQKDYEKRIHYNMCSWTFQLVLNCVRVPFLQQQHQHFFFSRLNEIGQNRQHGEFFIYSKTCKYWQNYYLLKEKTNCRNSTNS